MQKKFPLKENIAIPFFSATHMQNFCNKCYIRSTPHSDDSKLEGCKIRNNFYVQSLKMCTVLYIASSVATSDVLTSDLKFSEKFLMSDVLPINLTLTGQVFLFPAIPLFLG